MEYPWYEEICKSDEITQGDIIFKCAIPLPNEELFNTISHGNDTLESSLDLIKVDIIILSQACDIAHDKIDSIVACPVWPLKKLKKNSYYQSSNGIENLRQGKEPAYHLLNEHKSSNITNEYLFVDFHRIYSIPKTYLKKIVENIDIRLRLLPPYREHLSQAFARYFMRVGLPMDIDKESIKSA